jgi:hypothetical protein
MNHHDDTIIHRNDDLDNLLNQFIKVYGGEPTYYFLLNEFYNIYYSELNNFIDKEYNQDEYKILLSSITTGVRECKIEIEEEMKNMRTNLTNKLTESSFYKTYKDVYMSDMILLDEFNIFYDNIELTLDKGKIVTLCRRWFSSMKAKGIINFLHKATKLNYEICEYIVKFL